MEPLNSTVFERASFPQAHGGILKPFPKGVSGNPGGKTELQKRARQASRMLIEESIETLAFCMRQRDDIRAALIASQAILDRALGKPKETGDDDQPVGLDLSKCPPEALALIKQALALIATAAPKQEVISPDPTTSSG